MVRPCVRHQCSLSSANTALHHQPSFPEITLPPLTPTPFTDRGLFASPGKATLYAEIEQQGGKAVHQTPALGVEIRGVKLQKLSKAALDDLALLVAERGIVGTFLLLNLQIVQANSTDVMRANSL